MVIYEIQSDIEAIEKDAALYEETNFNNRVEAIDYLEFYVIDRIEGLLQTTHTPAELISLKQYAERVKQQLEAVDDTLFQRLRADIRLGRYSETALKNLLDEYVQRDLKDNQEPHKIGYDSLDMFVNGLLLSQTIPVETKDREPEMVYYQQTPSRIIVELVEKARFTKEDVFYDLGSGLGQVVILVHLLSGATTRGVEFEPAYCDYAQECAASLNLTRVEFINTDARTADYSQGTAFFMYTPFEGNLLQTVLEKLREESQHRKIRLFTYGTCTAQVARQSWLKCVDPHGADLNRLNVFSSL